MGAAKGNCARDNPRQNICVVSVESAGETGELVSQSFVGCLVAICIILDNVLRTVLAYSNCQRLRRNSLRQYFVI